MDYASGFSYILCFYLVIYIVTIYKTPPKTECGCPSGGGIKNAVTYATLPMEERRGKTNIYIYDHDFKVNKTMYGVHPFEGDIRRRGRERKGQTVPKQD